MKFFENIGGYLSLILAGSPSTVDLGTLTLGCVCAIASGVPFPLIGILFGQLLNDFNGATCDADATEPSQSASSYSSNIDGKILVIVYLAIAQAVTIFVHLSCWSVYGARLAQRLREKYLESLLRQEPAYFDSLPTGEVASRLDGDIQAIRSGTSEKMGICISSLSFFVTAYIVAFIKDAKLAGMLVSLVPAYFLMSLIGSYYIEKYSGLMSDYAASAASIASEALSNTVVVQVFGANHRLERKFAACLKASKHEGLKKAAAVGVQAGLLYFIAYAANGLAFWQGSRQIAEALQHDTSGTTVGGVFTVIFVLVEATLLLSQVAPFLHLFTAAVASHRKLRVTFDRESLIDSVNASGDETKTTGGGFEFQDVSFSYPSRPEIVVLDHVNFSIPSNKHTAIVGLSGSGKSTIAGLVTRLYDPSNGTISFDGRDIRKINVRSLRSSIGLVQQEPSLLDRSILENIAHGLIGSSKSAHQDMQKILLGPLLGELATAVREGKELSSEAEARGPQVAEVVSLVRQAAELADADVFITALQHGYGTIVGSSGRLISGGQKQRIAIARALVRDPSIVVLDEATAALDSLSEQRIWRGLSHLSKENKTFITIAHRLSTIHDADNIIVMHGGRIVEQGTHAALMAHNGRYASMVHLQQSGSTSIDHQDTTDDVEALPKESSLLGDEKADIDEKKASIDVADVASSTASSEEPSIPSKSLWALARGYYPALRPHLLPATAALIGAVIVGGAFSAEAVIFGNTVGSLSPCESPSYIRSKGSFFGLMFFLLALIELFANIVSWFGFGFVSEKLIYTVRILSFRSLMEQDLQWHQSKGRTPALLLSYITRDGNALAGLSGSVLGTLFSITVNLVAAVILTTIVAWRIALVCLALVPLLLGAGIMELRVLGQFEEEHASAYNHSVDLGVEATSNIKTIAAFSLENATLVTYRDSLKGPRKEVLKVTLQASFWQTSMYFLGNCVNALAYWWGAKQIINGNYTQTQFLIVVFSLLVSALLWSQTFALAPELSSARAAMARILGLIESGSGKMRGTPEPRRSDADLEQPEPDTCGKEKAVLPARDQGLSVKLRNIHFAYPARPDVKVLKGLDLEVSEGQFCALVGPSGAGKSTIVSMIERLYTPASGTITIDGCDITQTRDFSFRNMMSLVPQDVALFDGSVEFNVGLGAQPGYTATLDKIKEVCKIANIHDTIESLPDGYDTLCGSGGNQFSGGQKQRLAIARALLRTPRLLILDEPTSALDAESEHLLQQGLDRVAKSTTVIAIAHRLQTIQKADVIFLIDDGRCVDRGTHHELMERSQSYRANVTHQMVADRD